MGVADIFVQRLMGHLPPAGTNLVDKPGTNSNAPVIGTIAAQTSLQVGIITKLFVVHLSELNFGCRRYGVVVLPVDRHDEVVLKPLGVFQ